MSSQVGLHQVEIKGFIIMLVLNTDDTAVELMKRHLKLPMLTSRSYLLGLVETGSTLANVFEESTVGFSNLNHRENGFSSIRSR